MTLPDAAGTDRATGVVRPQGSDQLGGSIDPRASKNQNQPQRPAPPAIGSSALPEERLRVALAGAAYFVAEADLDLDAGDLEGLREHVSCLRQTVIRLVQAFNELPVPPWPNAETREAFGRSAAEWRKDRDRVDPIRADPNATGNVWADAERPPSARAAERRPTRMTKESA
jgi:hypothetical protein